MALPRWFWDREAFSASWAWGWRLKSHQRREVLKLADAGERHPDPRVAAIARRYSAAQHSTLAFTVETVSAIAIFVVAVIALKWWWPAVPVAGGIAAAIVGVGFSIWRHVESSRLSKVYRNPEAANNPPGPPHSRGHE